MLFIFGTEKTARIKKNKWVCGEYFSLKMVFGSSLKITFNCVSIYSIICYLLFPGRALVNVNSSLVICRLIALCERAPGHKYILSTIYTIYCIHHWLHWLVVGLYHTLFENKVCISPYEPYRVHTRVLTLH